MKIGILSRIKSNEYLLIIFLFILGINLMLFPDWNLGLFAGIGFSFTGLGINADTKIRLTSQYSLSRTVPYIIAMYGYNAAIHVANTFQIELAFSKD